MARDIFPETGFCFADLQRWPWVDWNDLKLFLTVARLGSIRAAAQALGVNQSTVNRRLDCLEHALGLTLFDITTRGHVLTVQGRALADAAAPMQDQAEVVLRMAQGLTRKLTGTLKITAPQALFKDSIAPIIAEFHHCHPHIHLSYDDSERVLDLLAGEADIAFRAGWVRPDDRFWSARACDHLWAVYCSHAYAERRGVPGGLGDLHGHDLVSLGGPVGLGQGNQWFMARLSGISIAGVAEGVNSMQKILMAGLGVGILPCVSGDQEPRLLRCFDPLPEMTSHLWVVTTPVLSRDPRVKAFTDLALKRMRGAGPGISP